MKKITVIFMLTFFLVSCSENNYNGTKQGIVNSEIENSVIHPWEFIIEVVDNNNNPATQNFCVYRTQDNSIHGCGTNPLGGWWAANVDEIQWPQIPEEIIPNLIYGVEYKIQTFPNDHSDIIIIKFLSAGAPDTYFKFNVDTGRMTLTSLGQNVEVRILAGKR